MPSARKKKAPAPTPRRALPAVTDPVTSLLVCLALAAALNFTHDRVTDPDSFYHWRHAWVYATQGLTEAAFPWAQFSVIRTLAADLWYGLHVLMIPLTWLDDPVWSLKVGSFVSTAVSLILFYVAQKRLGTAWPLLGTLIFAGATADLLYRITMLRPHPISLGLTLLAFADLTADPPAADRRRLLRLFVLSALVAWLHLAVAWLPLLVAGVAGAVRLVRRTPRDVLGPVATLAGAVAGWLLRPNPFAALKLAYIQVAYLTLQQQGGAALRFGNELRPFHLSELYKQLPGILLLLLVGVALLVSFWRRRADLGTALWSSLVLWPLFFVLAFVVFRRANEVMMAFAVTFLGLVAARARAAVGSGGVLRSALASWPGTLAAGAVVLALLVMPIRTMTRFSLFLPRAYDPQRFRAVGEWLEKNSAPGEIVFVDWDRFGYLVFWNPHNHYIHGMDPIFMYAYDAGLYWKGHYLAADQVTAHTYASPPGSKAVPEDTHTVLRRDFRASFILLEPRNEKLVAYLRGTPGFVKVLQTEQEILFRIVDRGQAGS